MSPAAVLVRGSDPVLLSDAALAAIDELVGTADRAEVLDEFSGDDYDISDAVMAANSVSMFGDRVVVLRNASRFDAAALKPLITYLDQPNPTSAVVVVWDKPLSPGAKAASLPKKLVDAVKQAGGTVVDADPPAQAKARQGWIDQRLADSPVALTPAARQMLVDRLGDDVGRLGGVLDLLAHLGVSGKLGPDDIEPYLGTAGGVPPWELTDAIDKGNVALAVDKLHRMMAGGDRHPLQIMATLVTHVDRMMRLDGAGVRDEAEAASLLGMKGSTFPAKKAMESARRLGSARIARAVQLLAQADVDLRGTIDWPPELVMEVTVARLARLSARR